jgi:hypothetical protein
MKTTKKSELRAKVETAMNQALSSLEIPAPSKKTKKIIDKASKNVTKGVVRDLKKVQKTVLKEAKKNAKKKIKSPAKS